MHIDFVTYPYIPQNDAGIRIDPPISVPIPRTEPPHAIKPPSPPDEPPLKSTTEQHNELVR